MLVKARFCQYLLETELKSLSNIPFTLHVETRPTPDELSLNPINFYVTWEPEEYFNGASYAKLNADKFDYILTWNKDLLREVPNAVFCPFGTSPFYDVLPLYYSGDEPKEPKVTFIRGMKHFAVQGHHLRHELYDRRFEIKNIKSEFYDRTNPEYGRNPEEDIRWFTQRSQIFKTSLYHICIENTFHENYFTEKIMDCFLFRTVPIYWGCPNIGEFFDKDGIITFDNIDELIYICNNNLSIDDYNNRIFALYKNQIECQKYLNLGKTIRDTIKSIFESKYPQFSI